MSSKPDRREEALTAFNNKTDAFLVDLMKEATARGFCHACALNFVATLISVACEVVDHDREKLTDEPPRTAFDNTPGHA
jgi:hypothetical protein